MGNREDSKLSYDIIKDIESDLKHYPDWTIRMEMGGLGSPSKYGVDIQRSLSCESYIENDYEITEFIKNKVDTIDRVMDRLAILSGKTKILVEQRYFQGYEVVEVMKTTGLSKRGFYTVRDRALESFARAMGYIH